MSSRSEAAKPLAAPREWWIDLHACYEKGWWTEDPTKYTPSIKDQIVHVIEKSAYDTAIDERDKFIEKYHHIELANTELTRNDHVVFGYLLEQNQLLNVERDAAITERDGALKQAGHHDSLRSMIESNRDQLRIDKAELVAERDELRETLEQERRNPCPKCGYLGCARGRKACDAELDAALALLREARDSAKLLLGRLNRAGIDCQSALETLTRIDGSGILSKEEK